MLKKPRVKILILLISITIIIIYFFINIIVENKKIKNLTSFLGYEQKEFIKKYFFPYKVISQRDEIIDQMILQRYKEKFELSFKEAGNEIRVVESYVNLTNNKTFNKYFLTAGFGAEINDNLPSSGSGFIDFYEGNIIVLSSRGVLAFKKNIEDTKENFQQINNNINEFIGINQFKK